MPRGRKRKARDSKPKKRSRSRSRKPRARKAARRSKMVMTVAGPPKTADVTLRTCHGGKFSTTATQTFLLLVLPIMDCKDPTGVLGTEAPNYLNAWNNFYDLYLVKEWEVTMRWINKDITEPFYVWIYFQRGPSSTIGTSDGFKQLCETKSLKKWLITADAVDGSGKRSATMRAKIKPAKMCKTFTGAVDSAYPSDFQGILGGQPRQTIYAVVGITTVNGNTFSTSRQLDWTMDIRQRCTLYNREAEVA